MDDSKPFFHSVLRQRWMQLLGWIVSNIYYSGLRVVGAPLGRASHQLLVCSHRNGAVDGFLIQSVCPHVLFALSVQLLRHRLLRLVFSGIAVVRPKDIERYGQKIAHLAKGDALEACCAHLGAGGQLAMFPEGTSSFGPNPLPYKRGTARIICNLLTQNVPIEVVPLGLFYTAPERFRSPVELLVGPPVVLPPRSTEGGHLAWEEQVHQAVTNALNDVSVNCPDQESFEGVCRLANCDSSQGHSYAMAFKRWEGVARTARALPAPVSSPPHRWEQGARALCGAPGLALFWPLAVAALIAGHRADGRNTIAFFRILGAAVVCLVWLPIVLILGWFFPLSVLSWTLVAALLWPFFKR